MNDAESSAAQMALAQWGPAWRGLRDDLNRLIWLFEEERVLQRLYLESAFWALTGTRFPIDQFAAEVGFGPSDQSAADDPELPKESALDRGVPG